MNLGYRETLVVTAGAYSDNDVMGGLKIIKFVPGFNNLLLNFITVTDIIQQEPVLRIHFYDAAPTTIADNVAYARSDADLLFWIKTIDITTWVANASVNSAATVVDINQTLSAPLGSLWYYLEINDAGPPTFTGTSDISIIIDGLLEI